MVMSNITLKGLEPDMEMLGAYERFTFSDTDPIIKFEIYSPFAPTVPNDSVINIVSRNFNLAGFRLKHTTKTTSSQDFGECVFQAFEADGAGTIVPIWSYIDTPGEMGIHLTLNMGDYQIQHVGGIAMSGAQSYFGGNGQIAFDNTYAAKRIQLYGAVASPGNNFQYMGFGTAATGILGYNTITGGKHAFYAATSSTTKDTLAEIAETYVQFFKTVYGRKSSGIMSWSGNTTDTASLTLNTWTKVLGTTTAGTANVSDVTMSANNRLAYSTTYPGTLNTTFLITASITFQNRSAAAAGLLSFGIYKNGTTLLTPQCRETLVVSNTNSLNATVQVLETLAPTDYIELWCMNSATSATGIRVTDCTVSMVAV